MGANGLSESLDHCGSPFSPAVGGGRFRLKEASEPPHIPDLALLPAMKSKKWAVNMGGGGELSRICYFEQNSIFLEKNTTYRIVESVPLN